ncbi:hypothetical protein N7454_003819 [Penicillium verhagenii]|nr:hypothetical protein N7454_003819 [Penicillium verhagenii]
MASISFGSNNKGLQVGRSHGPIYFTSEQSETRSEPLSTVPFPHDQDFVSRDELLEQIHEKSSVTGSITVLIGLGGVGKTRLAIEHCHRIRQQSPDTWVFWVHASTAARCEESLRDLADRAKIPGRQDLNSNICQLFGNWLRDGKIGEWILVLDNVDDDELLRKPLVPRIPHTESQASTQNHISTQPPLRYLLRSHSGSIIITSRNKGVALDIAGHEKNLIHIKPMNMDEALGLVQKKLDRPSKREELVQLVEELEFMPLAIMQATSYIIRRSPRCSVAQYLDKLRQSDRHAIKLLNHEGLHTHRDWEAKNSILLTLQILFEYIQHTRPSAADLLSLMSFFNWQAIPEKLLRVQGKGKGKESLGSLEDTARIFSQKDTDISSECDLEDDFESDILTLQDFSFITTITTDKNSKVFTMHQLVQLTVQAWLKTSAQDEH